MPINRAAAALALTCALIVSACGRDDPGSTRGPETGAPTIKPATAGARYAHLGDSFAAGSGIDPLVADSPAVCLRSQLNFGQLIAKRKGLLGTPDFADVSCGGATTANLTVEQYFGVGPQADVLGGATEIVTLLIGGNDGRLFADALAQCSSVADRGGDPCQRAHRDQYDKAITDTIAPALDKAVALVARRAPRARIFVVGYPRILPPETGCYPTMRVAAGDVAFLNRIQQRLNSAIAVAAADHHAEYVDMWSASRGNDACASPDQRWMEPMLGSRIRTTVHPNAAGQRAIADAVLAALE